MWFFELFRDHTKEAKAKILNYAKDFAGSFILKSNESEPKYETYEAEYLRTKNRKPDIVRTRAITSENEAEFVKDMNPGDKMLTYIVSEDNENGKGIIHNLMASEYFYAVHKAHIREIIKNTCCEKSEDRIEEMAQKYAIKLIPGFLKARDIIDKNMNQSYLKGCSAKTAEKILHDIRDAVKEAENKKNDKDIDSIEYCNALKCAELALSDAFAKYLNVGIVKNKNKSPRKSVIREEERC